MSCVGRKLGVSIPSDLKFDQYINNKCTKSQKVFGEIKHLMYDAPKDVKLLVYTSLCRPILDYAVIMQMWSGILRLEVRCMI